MGTLGIPGYAQSKWYNKLVGDFDLYLHAKNKLHHLYLSWDIIFLNIPQFAHNSRNRFFQIRDRWWNINSNITFHFRLFPGKTSDKITQKIQQKTLFWGHLGSFLTKFGQKWIFLEKNGPVSFYIFQLSTIFQKIQKKTLINSREKWQTDKLMDRQIMIYRTLRRLGSNILSGIANSIEKLLFQQILFSLTLVNM